MRPGVWKYHVKKLFQDGWKSTWYRTRVRPRILLTPSILLPQSSDYEIHVLTSIDDWMNLIWSLKSFYFYSRSRAALCIHDDGTLTNEIRDTLATHFVGARIIVRETADLEVLPLLKGFPNCTRFRESNNLSLKVFDIKHYAQASRIFLIDSDVLTFSAPGVLLDSLNDPQTKNRFNSDIANT